MRKSSWLPVCAFLLAIGASLFPAFADDAPASGPTANMPQREHDLIEILTNARKQYTTSHSPTSAQDARIAMQIQVISYMRQSQLATDWVGTVKSRGITPEGDAWITIEIADGITVSTWTTVRDDGDSATMFRPHSKLFAPAQAAKIASPVVFSGTILKSILAEDEDMVLRPRFIARFSALKLAE